MRNKYYQQKRVYTKTDIKRIALTAILFIVFLALIFGAVEHYDVIKIIYETHTGIAVAVFFAPIIVFMSATIANYHIR